MPPHRSRRLPGAAIPVLLLAVLAALSLRPAPAVAQDPASPGGARAGEVDAPVVVYLVRHAEAGDDDPRDPALSEAGLVRAAGLARILEDVPLENVFSTDYRRTLQTAAPVAEEQGLGVQLYDPDGVGMAQFVALLRTTPGHHLVVGHSNTTPALVHALGGDPVSEIDHTEYDRLYVVTLRPGGAVTSTLLRVGPQSPVN